MRVAWSMWGGLNWTDGSYNRKMVLLQLINVILDPLTLTLTKRTTKMKVYSQIWELYFNFVYFCNNKVWVIRLSLSKRERERAEGKSDNNTGSAFQDLVQVFSVKLWIEQVFQVLKIPSRPGISNEPTLSKYFKYSRYFKRANFEQVFPTRLLMILSLTFISNERTLNR